MPSFLGEMVVKIVGDSAEFVRAIDKSEQKLTKFEKDLKTLTTTMTNVGKKMSLFVTLPILGLAAASVKAAADMEMQAASFKVLLGSAEAAKVLLQDLTDLAAKTPFQLTDLAESTKTMLAFGIESKKVLPILTQLGDIALGDREKLKSLTLAFSQMQSAGRLMGQDLLQMINAGFNPLQIIAEKTGETMLELKDRMSKGAISAEEVAEAFKIATSEGGLFYKGMETASLTLTGLISTLKDNIAALARAFGGILLPILKDFTARTTEFVQRFTALNENTLIWILRIAGLAAVVGPALIIVAKMITVVSTLRRAIVALNLTMAATPWGAVALAVIGLTALIWKMNEASREEKKLDRDIIALKDELNKVRGEEKIAIQETIVAKLRDAFVTAESEALKLEALTKTWGAYGKMDAAVASVTMSTEELRDKADDLNERFQQENKILGDLVEAHKEEIAQRVIGLPILEEETEEIKKLTKTKEDLVKANWEMAASYDGLGAHIAAPAGIYRAWRATWDDEDEQTEENTIKLVHYLDTLTKLNNATWDTMSSSELLLKEVEKLTDRYERLGGMVAGYAGPVFKTFGEIMISNADAAEKLKEAFKTAISGILQALGRQLAVMGAAALVPIPGIFNPAGAALAFAGSAAAYVAAGIVSALQKGGVTTGITPAMLHPNEAVIPLNDPAALAQIVAALEGARPTVNMGDNLFHVNIRVGNRQIYNDINRASRNGEIRIDARRGITR
jgi:tape measure domain-containing protein